MRRKSTVATTSDKSKGDAERSAARTAPLASIVDVVADPTPAAKLDAIDLKLLSLLAADSRTSQRRLARELQISPPSVGERIAKLEREGVIRGYTINIDWSALGYPVQVYLSVTASSSQGSILEALHQISEVEDIAVVAGAMDLLARVRVRDHMHLRRLLMDEIWKIPGVSRTETYLCLAEMPAKDFAHELIDALQRSANADSRG